jgi:hypothetical protein
VYEDTGSPATDKLIAFLDFTTDRTSSAGSFTIQWDATGILDLT